MQRLCDLSSVGKFGRGEAEAKENKPHNRVDVVNPASTTDITSKSRDPAARQLQLSDSQHSVAIL